MTSAQPTGTRRLGRFTFREQLEACLPSTLASKVHSSLEIIGSIAVLKLPIFGSEEKKDIANLVLRFFPRIKTVLNQTSAVEEELRVRQFEFVAGVDTRETMYREHGCVFKVDLKNAYFSPRLQYERLRIAKLVKRDEILVNMFAGIGSFSIIAAKHSKPGKAYSVDLNPRAVELGIENVSLNKMNGVVEFIEGDAKTVIESRLTGVADRVLMPLPMRALEYLPAAALALRNTQGTIHFYDFIRRRPDNTHLSGLAEKITKMLQALQLDAAVSGSRIVRSVGPNWEQVALDIHVKPNT